MLIISGVGSNVVCSTIPDNAKASSGGTGNKRFPRFFLFVRSELLTIYLFSREPEEKYNNYERKQVLKNLWHPCLFSLCSSKLLGNCRVFTSASFFMASNSVLGSNSWFFLYCFLGNQIDRGLPQSEGLHRKQRSSSRWRFCDSSHFLVCM